MSAARTCPASAQEPSVDPDAQTDTYAAVTFFIDNWRWAGVPFYIRTGKRLPKRVTDIAIQFKAPPLGLFTQETKAGLREVRPNLLVLRIQPEEGISLRFLSKSPGSGMRVRPVSMDFNYGSSFGERTPTAYETLLVDAMVGDPTLYTRQDMVEASWQIVQPILDVWAHTKFDFPNYPAGTWGPKASDEMLARQGHRLENSMSSAVISPAQPEQILKGLGKLWTSLGQEEKQQGKPTVLRACAMTLIVATDEADEGFAASQTISELMREHPSRGIVLAVSPRRAERSPQARVLAQCWKPFGKAQQICCEQIEIKARSDKLAQCRPDSARTDRRRSAGHFLVPASRCPQHVGDAPTSSRARSGNATGDQDHLRYARRGSCDLHAIDWRMAQNGPAHC